MYREIFAIDDDSERLGKSIRETLKQHELGNFSKSWKTNAKELEKWTPYDFLRGMKNALAPEPQMQGHEPRAQVIARAKDVPYVNWANLFSKTTKAMKGTLHAIESKEIGGDQERKDEILNSLENLIQKRYRALAVDLMEQRDRIMKGWKDELGKPYRWDQLVQT